jgi:hypothetical protein
MRSPIFSTTPSFAASTIASSVDSAPVVGWVLTMRTLRPTYFRAASPG